MLLQICAAAILTAGLLAAWRARLHYAGWLAEERGLSKSDLGFWAGAAALLIIDRYRLASRLQEPINKVHQVMIGLYGAKAALSQTRWFTAKVLFSMHGALMLCGVVGSISEGGPEWLFYGVMLSAFMPFMLYKQIQGELLRKRRLMLLELPELLNQLMLLIGAGETAAQALIRSAYQRRYVPASPLMAELALAVHALQMNVSFPKAMEDFSKRCGMQETTLFTTTLLLNYKRGGEELVMSLRELSFHLWEKRKALARTLGEEASSKLVFPMVIIFFVVMVVMAAPALFMAG